MRNVTLLEGDVVSHGQSLDKEFELERRVNPMEEEETKNTMCATWKDILFTLWKLMIGDSMKNSDLILELWQI